MTDQPSKKLDPKMLNLLKVMKNKTVFVKLQLRQCIKIYNVFQLYLFSKILTDSLTNQINPLSNPVIINIKEEWEVKDIIHVQVSKRNLSIGSNGLTRIKTKNGMM